MAADPNAAPTEGERLQLERARLECDKLRAEIAQTSLAWWKRPANLASVATLAALLTGWVSGYFPSEREKLQREIRDLRGRVEGSKQDALLVNSDLARLRAERDDMKVRSAELAEQAATAQRELKAQLAALEAARASTNAELARLRDERDRIVRDNKELASKADATQRRVDTVYLRLKLVGANAAYALSHLRPIREASGDLRSRFGASMTQLPADLAEPMRRLLEEDRIADDLLKETEHELARLRKELDAVPASLWAVRLVPHPDGRLYEPDYRRFYDVTDGRFHDVDAQGGASTDKRRR